MNNSLVEDALLPHLLDIVSDPAAEGLILAGGLGIQLKRQYLRDTEARTLITVGELPAVRPTQDIDLFLLIELFLKKERGATFRNLLNGLDYKPNKPNWKFGKPLGSAFPAHVEVILDLMARSPQEDENVKYDDMRVGKKSGTDLHGRNTPEAFAVEDVPLKIDVSGTRTDGMEIDAEVLVPHSYAWLNMKVKTAHDWLTQASANPSEKHTFDVYMLTAMLT